MKLCPLILAGGLFFSVIGGHQAEAKEEARKTWGDAIEMTKSIPLAEAVKSFSETKDSEKKLLVSGKVQRVCKMKGCWMIIKDSDSDIRVTFAEYAFFVPSNILNKDVEVEGKIFSKTVSVAEQKHLLEDDGAPREKIDAIKNPKKTIRFVATGVRLK